MSFKHWSSQLIYNLLEKKEVALKVFHQTNSVTETIRILGYPTRKQLYNWIAAEDAPPKVRKPLPRIANPPEHPRNPSLEIKLDAIKRCFEYGESIKYWYGKAGGMPTGTGQLMKLDLINNRIIKGLRNMIAILSKNGYHGIVNGHRFTCVYEQ